MPPRPHASSASSPQARRRCACRSNWAVPARRRPRRRSPTGSPCASRCRTPSPRCAAWWTRSCPSPTPTSCAPCASSTSTSASSSSRPARRALRDGQPVYERAIGWSDREAARRMRTDDIFRIASQTKALTSVGTMSLVEEGRIALSDPVSRYIPAFDRTTVATRSDTGRMIAPARRRITIRDLLTHTAGISYGTDSLVAPLYAAKALGSAAGWGWYTADKDEPVCTTMERLATLPFAAQPGERFVYGYNTDVLGCVIERVSGMPLDAFIRARITDPLGMRDTHFFLPLDKRGRLATVYASTGETQITRAPEGPRGQGDYVVGPRRSFAGGAGLLSTARAYSRFLPVLLNGGAL